MTEIIIKTLLIIATNKELMSLTPALKYNQKTLFNTMKQFLLLALLLLSCNGPKPVQEEETSQLEEILQKLKQEGVKTYNVSEAEFFAQANNKSDDQNKDTCYWEDGNEAHLIWCEVDNSSCYIAHYNYETQTQTTLDMNIVDATLICTLGSYNYL